MRRIEKAMARQVTFSKKRRGLIKRAEELSVLCDADLALIIFSNGGKLFEYASSSVKEIVERYNLQTKNQWRVEHPSLELQPVEDSNHCGFTKKVAERIHKLSRMRSEELQDLSVEELQELETSLEDGLRRVMQKKGEKIGKEINRLEEKRKKLMLENERLKRQVGNASNDHEYNGTVANSEIIVCEKRHSSESIDASNSSGHPHDYDSSETP